ncbi:hypothetical protein H109_06166 [Trichophyton interdigitale MR816]|uniref:Uncharacterized protein n=1 Tax=Trichophyton interdigitale (strain MR816) TaxID=1215338 RepID=A0A059J1Y5_TRIIM|nr:hypothetical protein H109_06166 [Trichophyton interdigitale MR816]
MAFSGDARLPSHHLVLPAWVAGLLVLGPVNRAGTVNFGVANARMVLGVHGVSTFPRSPYAKPGSSDLALAIFCESRGQVGCWTAGFGHEDATLSDIGSLGTPLMEV